MSLLQSVRHHAPAGVLSIASVVAAGIGTALLFFPVGFNAGSGIDIHGDVSAISEARSAGALILALGLLMMRLNLSGSTRSLGLVISSLTFLSYAIGRSVGIALDGAPDLVLLQAALIEWIVGLLSLACLRRTDLSRNAGDVNGHGVMSSGTGTPIGGCAARLSASS